MKADYVFSGGGILGIAFVGALKAMEEWHYEPVSIAGTSAGAIMAALVAAGYTADELYDVFINTDFSSFLTIPRFRLLKPFSLIFKKGIYDSRPLEEWLSGLLAKKGVVHFSDLKNPLKIVVSDVTQGRVMVLPDDLEYYGLNQNSFTVAQSAVMSSLIPFFFRPKRIYYVKGGMEKCSFIADGGIISGFPIWIFDSDDPTWPTFGFKLGSGTSPGHCAGNFFEYVEDVLNTMTSNNEERLCGNGDAVRTISIDTLGHKATQFSLPKADLEQLYKAGYDNARAFLLAWNFESYKARYRVISGRDRLSM